MSAEHKLNETEVIDNLYVFFSSDFLSITLTLSLQQTQCQAYFFPSPDETDNPIKRDAFLVLPKNIQKFLTLVTLLYMQNILSQQAG